MHLDMELAQFSTVLLLLGAAVALALGMMFLAHLLGPHNPTKEKQMSYECGEDPIGSAWLRFNIRFYVVALVFVLFDVDMALVYPIANVYRSICTSGGAEVALLVFGELVFFIAVLLLGLAYIWKKGDLGWVRTFRTPTDTGLRSWKNAAPAKTSSVAHSGACECSTK